MLLLPPPALPPPSPSDYHPAFAVITSSPAAVFNPVVTPAWEPALIFPVFFAPVLPWGNLFVVSKMIQNPAAGQVLVSPLSLLPPPTPHIWTFFVPQPMEHPHPQPQNGFIPPSVVWN